MKIVNAASALPQYSYDQSEVSAELARVCISDDGRADALQRLHARCGVERRHFVLPLEAYERIGSWGQANDLWIEHAQQLGVQAICRAITPAGILPQQIDALYFTTVTGVASPSIDARLMNHMGLAPNMKRVPIFGLGCVAGAAGTARAADYVRAFPDEIAVVLAIELCSLTWQREDTSIANLISSGLFGDGAAAVVVAGADTEYSGPSVVATRSTFYPGTENVMGWDISENGFQIVLSPDVPKVVKQNLRADVDSFLADFGLRRDDIASWIIHTGGPKVLGAVADGLELPDGALDLSWECLSEVGNLSSASVLLVLEKVLNRERQEPGRYSLMAAMGPGFCSELVLLRW